jgi:hypothetical protein
MWDQRRGENVLCYEEYKEVLRRRNVAIAVAFDTSLYTLRQRNTPRRQNTSGIVVVHDNHVSLLLNIVK